jgi:hypothetical protein
MKADVEVRNQVISTISPSRFAGLCRTSALSGIGKTHFASAALEHAANAQAQIPRIIF